MLTAEILTDFVSIKFQGGAPKTLADTMCDFDIVNFINVRI